MTISGPVRSLAVAAVLALTTSLVAPAAGADDLRDRDKKAQGQVQRAEGALKESSKRVTKAQRRLAAAQQQLEGAQSRLGDARTELGAAQVRDAQMAERLAAAEAELARARADLEEARAEVAAQRADIGRLAAAMYAGGDPQLMGLSVMLNSQDPAAATSQLNTATALMDRQSVTLDELRETRQRMVDSEARVAEATARVADERAAAAATLEQRQQLESAAQSAAVEVRGLVGQSRAARQSAVRVRAADQRALRAAEAQAAQIKQLIMRRAAQQRGAGFQGASDGFLARPVPGPITSSYGYRVHPIYGYYGLHDGTDFGTPCGTPNIAVGTGTVISRQWSDVYGNRLYLDVGRVNGKNVTVVYNHLSGYAVSSGQRVSRGQVVGYAGSTGWSTGCHLHFTVLENGNPVDPIKYL